MSIQITAKSMDEVPEEMKEFVTQGENGVFLYDNDKAFKALKDEREISKTAKAGKANIQNVCGKISHTISHTFFRFICFWNLKFEAKNGNLVGI